MAFLYPWGNTQQLNLDWILQKIKVLETGSGSADLDEVANALISASYSVQAYDRSDIVFRDGKLYRANQAIPAPGETWTPAHWDEILLGDTVSNLVQYVAALSNDQIANNSGVAGTHTSDALDTLNIAIALLNAAFQTVQVVTDVSDFGTKSCFFSANANITLTPTTTVIPIYSKGLFITTGVDGVLYAITSSGELITAYRNGVNWTNVKNIPNLISSEALARSDADNNIESAIAIVADGDTHATITARQYVYIKNHATLAEGLYKANASTPANDPITAASVDAVPNGVANAALAESSTEVVLSNKNDNAQITKIGRFCFLESNQDFSSLANGLQTIGTIPAGFRPAKYTRFVILNKTASQESVAYYGTIYTTGNIEIFWGGSAISTPTNGSFNVFYLCEV